eukprot:230955-Chlamydomonas_euryale.AAC.4
MAGQAFGYAHAPRDRFWDTRMRGQCRQPGKECGGGCETRGAGTQCAPPPPAVVAARAEHALWKRRQRQLRQGMRKRVSGRQAQPWETEWERETRSHGQAVRRGRGRCRPLCAGADIAHIRFVAGVWRGCILPAGAQPQQVVIEEKAREKKYSSTCHAPTRTRRQPLSLRARTGTLARFQRRDGSP